MNAPALGQDGKGKAKAEAPASPNYPAWRMPFPPAPPPGSAPPAPVNDDGKMLSLPGTDLQFHVQQGSWPREATTTRTAPHPPTGIPETIRRCPKSSPRVTMRAASSRARSAPAARQGTSRERAADGATAGYTVQQLMDFKNGLRRSGDPRKGNTNNMINFAKAMTDQEMREAAAYYAAQKWTPWIRVVESAQAPKVRSQAGMWIPLQGADAGMDPIGARIIEDAGKSGIRREDAQRTLGLRRLRAGRLGRQGPADRHERRSGSRHRRLRRLPRW
jgi:hypothetical protein